MYGAGKGGQTLGKAFGGAIDGTGRVVGEEFAGKAAVFGCNKTNEIKIATITNATIVAAITNGDGRGEDVVGDDVPPTPTPTPYEFTILLAMSLEIFWTPLIAILASILDLQRATKG